MLMWIVLPRSDGTAGRRRAGRSPGSPGTGSALVAVLAAIALAGCGGEELASPSTDADVAGPAEILVASGNVEEITLPEGQQTQIPIHVDLSEAPGVNVAEIDVTVTWDDFFVKALVLEPGNVDGVEIDDSGMFEGVFRSVLDADEGLERSFTLVRSTFEAFHAGGGSDIALEVNEIRNERGESLISLVRTRELRVDVDDGG